MADEEEQEKRKIKHGVYRVGEKYYCATCNTGLQFGANCPDCLTHLDWEKIQMEFRH